MEVILLWVIMVVVGYFVLKYFVVPAIMRNFFDKFWCLLLFVLCTNIAIGQTYCTVIGANQELPRRGSNIIMIGDSKNVYSIDSAGCLYLNGQLQDTFKMEILESICITNNFGSAMAWNSVPLVIFHGFDNCVNAVQYGVSKKEITFKYDWLLVAGLTTLHESNGFIFINGFQVQKSTGIIKQRFKCYRI